MKTSTSLIAVCTLAVAGACLADTTAARCDLYPAGADHAAKSMHCTFSQRQGAVTIDRADGVIHDLTPAGEAAGEYRDRRGQAVRRETLDDQGLVFRFPDEAVYVYWSTAGLDDGPSGNPTAPFSTSDYDATALLPCQATRDAPRRECPAGVLRMEDGQASVVVQDTTGAQYTINFMKDYINATNRNVDATLKGDRWVLILDGAAILEVPLAFIRGG